MNVTSEIKNNEKLKKILNETIIFKPFDVEKKENILFPLKTDYKGSAIVGTAYDYLFRLELSKQNKIKIDLNDFIGLKYTPYKNDLIKILEKRGELFFETIIYISLIESYYRSGNEDYKKIKELSEIKENYKNELSDLQGFKIDLSEFKGKEFILNPVLGYGNLKADADLIMDKCLIDLKTITSARFDKDKINQLIIYTALLYIYDCEITEIAIFFSRYNKLAKLKLKEVITPKDFRKIINFIEKEYN